MLRIDGLLLATYPTRADLEPLLARYRDLTLNYLAAVRRLARGTH